MRVSTALVLGVVAYLLYNADSSEAAEQQLSGGAGEGCVTPSSRSLVTVRRDNLPWLKGMYDGTAQPFILSGNQ